MLGDKKANIKVGGDFDPVPADKYTVQIADVNMVTQFNKWKGEDQDLLNYQYIILDKNEMEDGSTTRGRYLWHRVSQSLSAKSWLLKLVKAVYGRDLTREEMEAFDPESIIGKQVDVLVEQNPNKTGDTIYNNVTSYSKTIKELEPVDFTPNATAEIENESEPAVKQVDAPDLTPEGGLDFAKAFASDLEKENEEAEEEELSEDEELKKMEEELAKKKAQLKAKKATEKATTAKAK